MAVLLLVGLFIPMGWGAPQGPALVVRQSVQIVPDVAGQVIDVPVEPNKPLKANDVLFRIDPVPYESQVNALEAQLKFQEIRLAQVTELQARGVGRANDVAEYQATVDQLKAQVVGAKWNLEKTVVRAPADGYVTNVALRKGARVSNLPLAPVMAFIDTSETIVGVEIPQIDARYVVAGQDVEVTFKFAPGQGYTGKVVAVLQAIASGQVGASGLAAAPKQIQAAPFVVRVTLDDADFAGRLPAGQHRRGGHLHRPGEGGARHSQGAAAPDRDHELHQSVLSIQRLVRSQREKSGFAAWRTWRGAGLSPRRTARQT